MVTSALVGYPQTREKVHAERTQTASAPDLAATLEGDTHSGKKGTWEEREDNIWPNLTDCAVSAV